MSLRPDVQPLGYVPAWGRAKTMKWESPTSPNANRKSHDEQLARTTKNLSSYDLD